MAAAIDVALMWTGPPPTTTRELVLLYGRFTLTLLAALSMSTGSAWARAWAIGWTAGSLGVTALIGAFALVGGWLMLMTAGPERAGALVSVLGLVTLVRLVPAATIITILMRADVRAVFEPAAHWHTFIGIAAAILGVGL